jgi:molybdenum cofactor guanylyltransferase
MARAAAIVLAGGRSSRMGFPKAGLDWHGSTLLRRVTGLVARAVDGPVVVVSAPGQELPELPAGVRVVSDAIEGRGPVQGLAAGLEVVGADAEVAYVSATDVPLLHPAFVTGVIAALTDEFDVALPDLGGFRQPLAAAYRPALLGTLNELIAADLMRMAFLFERCRVLELDQATLLGDPALAREDPELVSVANINGPDDYQRVSALPAPEIQIALSDGTGVESVRAWSLGELGRATGMELGDRGVLVLNGTPVGDDPELPLVAGDVVTLA